MKNKVISEDVNLVLMRCKWMQETDVTKNVRYGVQEQKESKNKQISNLKAQNITKISNYLF